MNSNLTRVQDLTFYSDFKIRQVSGWTSEFNINETTTKQLESRWIKVQIILVENLTEVGIEIQD